MLISTGIFRDVSMVVTFHFMEEDFSFWGSRTLEEVGINQLEDILAELVKLSLNFGFVLSN